jgi:signal transduction histidine kinase
VGWRVRMVGVGRSVSACLAAVCAPRGVRGRSLVGVMAWGLLMAGCSWALARAHPLAGIWAVGVAVGYAYAAYLCSPANRGVAWWLRACSVLWAGSVTDAVRWAAAPAAACWVALWVTLAAGALVLRRDVSKSPFPGRWPGGRVKVRGIRGAGPRLRGITLAAGLSAGAVAATSLAVAGVTWTGAGGLRAAQWWPGPARSPWVVAVQGVCAAAVPLAVGVDAWSRRWARASVSALLTRLATPPTVEGVQAVLRAALGDPTAAVFYRLPDVPDFISAAGERVELPEGPGRLVFPVAGPDGEISALLSVDESLSVDAGRVQAALAGCGPALENARLQAVLRGQLREVRASRARIVQAAVAERRKLARDLHDGAQQYLLVLSTRLGMARQKATHPQSLAAIDAARDQLRIALSKLRGLGRDLYPAVLDTEGLTAALESLADDGPLDVDLASRTGRLDPGIEIVAYLTVRETLEGLAQHAAATHARVTVIAESDRLTVQVASDGTPGDEPRIPPWLSVITDRIRADGGDISIGSTPDPVTAQGGVWVEAWIPCG